MVPSVKKWDGNAMSQDDMMLKDTVIVLDDQDKIIGSASKKESHVFDEEQPRGILHRAFSVFLFDESTGELLLQQRASTKITFPNVWTNTCCSHPLHGMEPSEVDSPEDVASGTVLGVKYAAIRKLDHELGIPSNQLPVEKFKFLTRLQYWAADTVTHGKDSPWGENEIDYVLFFCVKNKNELTIKPHPDEVDAIKWVSPKELDEMMKDSSLLFSPWFRLICKKWLVTSWWKNLKQTMTTDDHCDYGTIHKFDPSKEHLGGKGKAGPLFDGEQGVKSEAKRQSPLMSLEEIKSLDQEHVWHPYAAMPNAVPCFPVEKASGCEITLTDGRVLIDGMSSWWAAIHGYNHPVLNAAAKAQMDKMSHIMFGGLTHEPAVALAKELARIAPGSGDHKLDKIFYCDSGSVAVEVAMKMAIQYWFNKGNSAKSKFLTIRGGYHGDTFEAMSVCDPVGGMHHLFSSTLPQQIFCNRPETKYHEEWDESDIQSFQQRLEKNKDEIAAVILEPIVQGAGGMRFYSPHYLQRVRDLCDEHDVLLICDEIATGFGRSGEMFAVEHAENVVPDILCIGKALSGGFLSFAATITSSKIARVFERGPAGVLMHGPTFMGNPLACAVSLASLQLLQSYDWKQKIQSIESQLAKELEPCRESPHVEDVRVLGAIGVVEMKEPMDLRVMQPRVVEEGVWLRPFGKLLYTMPPFIIQNHELRKITKAMVSLATRKRI